jgi:hypothetical protein
MCLATTQNCGFNTFLKLQDFLGFKKMKPELLFLNKYFGKNELSLSHSLLALFSLMVVASIKIVACKVMMKHASQ